MRALVALARTRARQTTAPTAERGLTGDHERTRWDVVDAGHGACQVRVSAAASVLSRRMMSAAGPISWIWPTPWPALIGRTPWSSSSASWANSARAARSPPVRARGRSTAPRSGWRGLVPYRAVQERDPPIVLFHQGMTQLVHNPHATERTNRIDEQRVRTVKRIDVTSHPEYTVQHQGLRSRR